jgi:Na+-driven multidrug efflux pump
MLCTLGLTTAFVRFIGGYHAEANWRVIKSVFNKGFKTVLITSTSIAIIIIAFSDFISNSLFDKPQFDKVVMAFAIPSFAIYQLVAFAFQGLHKPIISIYLQ